MNKFFLVFFGIYCFAISSFASINSDIDTKANQAIIIDYDTSEIIFEKDIDGKTFPSSMTKIMTSYIMFDLLKDDVFQDNDKFKISKKAYDQPGSRMFLELGTDVSIETLLKGLLIPSGNDAAVAIAEGAAGSEDEFVKLMNSKAKQLGLKNTRYNNASGLGSDNHYTTVREIALLSQFLIKNHRDEYNKYFGRTEFTYNGINQKNRNVLLTMFNGVDGIKTGHTDMGGYGIALSALRDDRRIILVINGLKSEKERADESLKLLKFVFEECKRVKLFLSNEEVGKADVWLGKKKKVSLFLKEDVIMTLKKDLIPTITADIEYTGPLEAPIKKDEVVAKLVIHIPNHEDRYYLLYATEDIDEINFFQRVLFLIKYKTFNIYNIMKNSLEKK